MEEEEGPLLTTWCLGQTPSPRWLPGFREGNSVWKFGLGAAEQWKVPGILLSCEPSFPLEPFLSPRSGLAGGAGWQEGLAVTVHCVSVCLRPPPCPPLKTHGPPTVPTDLCSCSGSSAGAKARSHHESTLLPLAPHLWMGQPIPHTSAVLTKLKCAGVTLFPHGYLFSGFGDPPPRPILAGS